MRGEELFDAGDDWPAPYALALRVERFIPFRSEHPRQRRQPTAQESPFKIIPAEILLAVLALDPARGLLRALQDRLLLLSQRLLAGLASWRFLVIQDPKVKETVGALYKRAWDEQVARGVEQVNRPLV